MSKYYKEENYIHYSTCQEDADLMVEYADHNYKGNALSIGSAGDNSFALLTKNFSNVYVLDNNPSQIALVKLKATGIKYLNYEDFLVLIGIAKGDSVAVYNSIKHNLDKQTQDYFDHNIFLFSKPLYKCGKFDNYLNLFVNKILPFIHSKKTVLEFMQCDNLKQQIDFYDNKFNTKRYRLLFKLFFSEHNMKKKGRDKSYFNHVSGNIAQNLFERVETGFKNVLNLNNPYIQLAALGEFKFLPFYLRKDNYLIIKENIDRLVYIEGDFSSIKTLNKVFDFYNLSDIFEYVSEDKTAEYEDIIINHSNRGTRIVFWNMIVKRSFKRTEFKRINSRFDLLRDKAFYYSNQYIYEVQ